MLSRLAQANTPAQSERETLDRVRVQQIELYSQNEQLRDARLELEATCARYREMFELAPVACLSLSADASILEANKAAGMLLGQRPQALVGQRLTKLLASEHVEAFEQHRRSVLSRDGRHSCTIELLLDGELREVRVESVYTGEGEHAEWRAALIDVTDVQRMQRQLQHSHKLEAMGAMASGVVHDINNLLIAMLGCTDMALSRLDADSPARAPLEELRRGALHGRTAVAQLLTFARKSEESAPAQPLGLHGALQEQAPVLRRLLGDTIALELDLCAERDAICIESERLEQILLNLATNARHAMPAGGSVRIATRSVQPAELERDVRADTGPSPCVMLEVSDTGPGMDERVRARAFEPFFTTKPAGLGTGLGLSMVYGAVRQSGGHCALQSRLGEGTVLRMYWPEISPRVDPSRSGTFQLAAVEQQQPAVLVVDDDRLVRLAIRHYLEKGGYRVIDFASGEHALEALRQKQVAASVLLSDVVLPGLKGPEIIAAAKKLQPDLRVMLVSAHAPELLIERGWLAPGVGLLRKPFSAKELHDALRAQLSTAAVPTAAFG